MGRRSRNAEGLLLAAVGVASAALIWSLSGDVNDVTLDVPLDAPLEPSSADTSRTPPAAAAARGAAENLPLAQKSESAESRVAAPISGRAMKALWDGSAKANAPGPGTGFTYDRLAWDVELDLPIGASLSDYEAEFDRRKSAEAAMAAARPKRKLKVVVRSQSGPMRGSVSIRADPVGQPPDGEPAYHKQWLDAPWTIEVTGEVLAKVELDELDVTKYQIRAVPGKGISITEPIQFVSSKSDEQDPIEFTATWH